MSWITITPDDIDAIKANPQVAALRTAALGVGQPDPVLDAIARVTLEIRQKIRSCNRNQLDADTTKIPSELKSLAQRAVYRELQQRLNLRSSSLPLSDDDRTHWNNDNKKLDAIAACELVVTTPDNPVDGGVQASGSIRVITSSRRQLSRRSVGGLS